MAKRKNQIDRAIEALDKDIAIVEGQLAVLRAAKARLESQQTPEAVKPLRRVSGHTEGGKGI